MKTNYIPIQKIRDEIGELEKEKVAVISCFIGDKRKPKNEKTSLEKCGKKERRW